VKTTNRQQQKERTREKLLQAAYRVFSRQGIMQSRMEDIAREAGVSHGTVFVHFKSQEALIEAVVDHYGKDIASRTHVLSQEGGSLAQVLAAHLQGIGEFESFYTRLLLESRLLPEGARDNFVGIQSVLSLHFCNVLARDKVAGDIPPYLLFNMWIGLVHHYLQNGDLFASGDSVIERCGPEILNGFLMLLGVR
jgi:AcrR family transcriptional regulator